MSADNGYPIIRWRWGGAYRLEWPILWSWSQRKGCDERSPAQPSVGGSTWTCTHASWVIAARCVSRFRSRDVRGCATGQHMARALARGCASIVQLPLGSGRPAVMVRAIPPQAQRERCACG